MKLLIIAVIAGCIFAIVVARVTYVLVARAVAGLLQLLSGSDDGQPAKRR